MCHCSWIAIVHLSFHISVIKVLQQWLQIVLFIVVCQEVNGYWNNLRPKNFVLIRHDFLKPCLCNIQLHLKQSYMHKSMWWGLIRISLLRCWTWLLSKKLSGTLLQGLPSLLPHMLACPHLWNTLRTLHWYKHLWPSLPSSLSSWYEPPCLFGVHYAPCSLVQFPTIKVIFTTD